MHNNLHLDHLRLHMDLHHYHRHLDNLMVNNKDPCLPEDAEENIKLNKIK
jgi:hypothetical protein